MGNRCSPCIKATCRLDRVAKRAEDLLLASVGLVLISPLLLMVVLAIKLDSRGPVLFKQKRLGFNNNTIVVYKFRTMVHRPEPETDVPQAVRGDVRVTRLGRLLRRSSIDELPQLFNVLRGEMSLVGPRPHALSHNERYAQQIDAYLGRHRVQPGITGWAQVHGLRGETDTIDKMQRQIDYDLAYIDQWSFTLDLKIMALTSFCFLLQPERLLRLQPLRRARARSAITLAPSRGRHFCRGGRIRSQCLGMRRQPNRRSRAAARIGDIFSDHVGVDPSIIRPVVVLVSTGVPRMRKPAPFLPRRSISASTPRVERATR